MDEYAAGGITPAAPSAAPVCNAYDTERDPGGSSGGSAVAVAANLVTCAIAEETGGSIVKPARWNNVRGHGRRRASSSAPTA
jgi:Asp-tRNA(Asn)/Glu-tRNA(Gln) amidotransferase A subunit family amidase